MRKWVKFLFWNKLHISYQPKENQKVANGKCVKLLKETFPRVQAIVQSYHQKWDTICDTTRSTKSNRSLWAEEATGSSGVASVHSSYTILMLRQPAGSNDTERNWDDPDGCSWPEQNDETTGREITLHKQIDDSIPIKSLTIRFEWNIEKKNLLSLAHMDNIYMTV